MDHKLSAQSGQSAQRWPGPGLAGGQLSLWLKRIGGIFRGLWVRHAARGVHTKILAIVTSCECDGFIQPRFYA